MTNKKILTLITLLLFLLLVVGCDVIKPNQPPEITSDPVEAATVGVDYTYDVDATDPNPEDVLTYTLTTEPSGMFIDPDNGLITWTPTIDDVGDVDVTVVVSDEKLSDTQSFTITVKEPEPEPEPEFVGIEVVPEAMNLFVKGSETITSVTAHYDDGSTPSIALGDCTYLSSDEEVATVLAGVVKGVGVGEATITIGYAGKTDTLEVTVSSILLTSIVIDPKTMTLYKGKSEDIKSVTAHYNDGSTKIVTSDCDYKSSKPGIVEIEKGTDKVTAEAIAYGEATITVTYKEEEITKTVYIEEIDTLEVKVIGPVHNITADRYYDTIQAAVNDAWVEGGDTIEVMAGTYDEQVVIDKGLTLQGAGDTTIIQPPAEELTATSSIPWIDGGTGTMSAIVSVETTGGIVIIKDLKIDGSLITSKSTLWLGGLVYLETSGTIDSVIVIGNSTLPDRTAGIFASAIGNPASLEVTGCTVIGYNRAGIYALGEEFTADYNNNEINGPGPIPGGVPNGIFFLESATGSATYNTITDLAYTGETWRSSGIGTWNAGLVTFEQNTISNAQYAFGLSNDTIGTIIEYNTIYDCEIGIWIESGATSSIIQYNNIVDNIHAIVCNDDMGGYNVAHYNNFVGNVGIGIPDYEGAVCNIHDTLVFDARYNWWGDASGPTHDTNPDGTGDTVSYNVIFIPWSPEEN